MEGKSKSLGRVTSDHPLGGFIWRDIPICYPMVRATLKGRYMKWGHSYGIRLRRKDAERLAVPAGTDVKVTVDTSAEPFDVGRIRTFRGPDARGARGHDRVLGEARRKRHSS